MSDPMSENKKNSEMMLAELSENLHVPLDVMRAICRLESKRLWRESWEKRVDAADDALDRMKEGGKP
jgi:predicted secreted protein